MSEGGPLGVLFRRSRKQDDAGDDSVSADDATPKEQAKTPSRAKARKATRKKTTAKKPTVRKKTSRGKKLTREEQILANISWRPASAEPESKEEPASKESARAPSKKRTPSTEGKTQLAALIEGEKPTKPKSTRQVSDEKKPSTPRKTTARAKSVPDKQMRPKREPVPTPEDAAQVVLHRGRPVIVFKKQIIPPISFYAAADSDEKFKTVLEQIQLASEGGVHLFSILVKFQVDSTGVKKAVDEIVKRSKAILKVDPDAKIVPRCMFVAPDDWREAYKNARYGKQTEPSICDDEYWGAAGKYLTQFVRKLQKSAVAKSILGLHIDRDQWYHSDSSAYDNSPAANKEFQIWLRHRYSDDVVSLRAAWYDGSIEFSSAAVPEHTEARAGEEFVRTGRKARRWVDYHLFLSDITFDRIAELAHIIKLASDGRFMVGVSYGYTFEWSHPASGHLSLGKLLRCREIDYVAGPPSYRGRSPSGSAAFPGPIDSFALNGKLFMSEQDFKTPISGQQEPDDSNPVMKTPQALESVHWRGAGAALAHDAGVCWMDSWGGGWLNSAAIWDRAGRVRQEMIQRIVVPNTPPDVAVFVDERSLAYLVDEKAFEVLVQDVREQILRSGMSVGFYLLSDLAHRENFPDAKLYVFLNAWDMRPEVRTAIKTRLQRDGKVLFWLYCAGLFEAGRESLERLREVTGIAIKPQPFHSKSGTTLVNMRDPLCSALPAERVADGGELEPSYYAIPEEGTVLGEYTQTGLASYLIKEADADGKPELAWTSVFLGEPVVSPGFFRALGELAHVHIWNFDDDVLHVRPPFLTVHCKGAGDRTIFLPQGWAAYNVLGKDWEELDSNSLRFSAMDGSTHVFLVGVKADLEAMLQVNPKDVLTVDSIERGDDDGADRHHAQFDVQIMKLDEWVEASWTDDMADDLLIKPSMLEVDDEEPQTELHRGRRRKRDRRRRPRETVPFTDRREGADRDSDPADVGVNVMFRKRE
ncbi:MAG: hypothetical protein IH944_01045 [Armatimonadetes bacterium]|nr:hypothetical protein [Armatimonadota bacterium]